MSNYLLGNPPQGTYSPYGSGTTSYSISVGQPSFSSSFGDGFYNFQPSTTIVQPVTTDMVQPVPSDVLLPDLSAYSYTSSAQRRQRNFEEFKRKVSPTGRAKPNPKRARANYPSPPQPSVTGPPDEPHIVLEIVNATNCPIGDRKGISGIPSSDPYVCVEIGDFEGRTVWKRDTLQPIWNETFYLPVASIRCPLVLTMFDHDNNKDDDLLCSFGEISLEPFLYGVKHEMTLKPENIALPCIRGTEPALSINITPVNCGKDYSPNGDIPAVTKETKKVHMDDDDDPNLQNLRAMVESLNIKNDSLEEQISFYRDQLLAAEASFIQPSTARAQPVEDSQEATVIAQPSPQPLESQVWMERLQEKEDLVIQLTEALAEQGRKNSEMKRKNDEIQADLEKAQKAVLDARAASVTRRDSKRRASIDPSLADPSKDSPEPIDRKRRDSTCSIRTVPASEVAAQSELAKSTLPGLSAEEQAKKTERKRAARQALLAACAKLAVKPEEGSGMWSFVNSQVKHREETHTKAVEDFAEISRKASQVMDKNKASQIKSADAALEAKKLEKARSKTALGRVLSRAGIKPKKATSDLASVIEQKKEQDLEKANDIIDNLDRQATSLDKSLSVEKDEQAAEHRARLAHKKKIHQMRKHLMMTRGVHAHHVDAPPKWYAKLMRELKSEVDRSHKQIEAAEAANQVLSSEAEGLYSRIADLQSLVAKLETDKETLKIQQQETTDQYLAVPGAPASNLTPAKQVAGSTPDTPANTPAKTPDRRHSTVSQAHSHGPKDHVAKAAPGEPPVEEKKKTCRKHLSRCLINVVARLAVGTEHDGLWKFVRAATDYRDEAKNKTIDEWEQTSQAVKEHQKRSKASQIEGMEAKLAAKKAAKKAASLSRPNSSLGDSMRRVLAKSGINLKTAANGNEFYDAIDRASKKHAERMTELADDMEKQTKAYVDAAKSDADRQKEESMRVLKEKKKRNEIMRHLLRTRAKDGWFVDAPARWYAKELRAIMSDAKQKPTEETVEQKAPTSESKDTVQAAPVDIKMSKQAVELIPDLKETVSDSIDLYHNQQAEINELQRLLKVQQEMNESVQEQLSIEREMNEARSAYDEASQTRTQRIPDNLTSMLRSSDNMSNNSLTGCSLSIKELEDLVLEQQGLIENLQKKADQLGIQPPQAGSRSGSPNGKALTSPLGSPLGPPSPLAEEEPTPSAAEDMKKGKTEGKVAKAESMTRPMTRPQTGTIGAASAPAIPRGSSMIMKPAEKGNIAERAIPKKKAVPRLSTIIAPATGSATTKKKSPGIQAIKAVARMAVANKKAKSAVKKPATVLLDKKIKAPEALEAPGPVDNKDKDTKEEKKKKASKSEDSKSRPSMEDAKEKPKSKKKA